MESVVYMRDNEVVSHFVDQTQMTKIYTNEALDFIDNHKEGPFFLFLSHNMPHVSLYASDEFIGSSERGLYGDVVQELDWSVGEIIKKIEDEGLLVYTLIIFSSDNGPWLVMEDHEGSSGGLREGKMYSFDGGMKVPMVAMWKGTIPEGSVYTEMATQLDWFPTFAGITGSELPEKIALDGQDITKVLNGTGLRNEDGYLFFESDILTGYRKGDWKVKLPFEGFEGNRWKNASTAHDSLLFNVKEDPFESNNLFNENGELARTLFKEMEQEYNSLGDLPPSIIRITPPDYSHFDYLESKNSEK